MRKTFAVKINLRQKIKKKLKMTNYTILDVIRTIKPGKMGWVAYVARMVQIVSRRNISIKDKYKMM